MYNYNIDNEYIPDKNPAFYKYYPRLFKNYFPHVQEQQISNLSKAGYLYYQSILFTDLVIDDKDFSKFPYISICQEESIKILTDNFGCNSGFWEFWKKRRVEYFEAVRLEKQLNLKKKITFRNYQILADYKSAFGKVAIDSLYCLTKGKDDNLYKTLLLSHKYFSVGFQLYDDIKDFKEDFYKKQFNWAIYQISKELSPANFNPDIDTLNKLLFLRGVGQKILFTSIYYFNKALKTLAPLHINSEWQEVILEMKNTIKNYLDITHGYIQTIGKKIEIEKQAGGQTIFFPIENIRRGTIKKGLQFIQLDYHNNYVGLKHFMYLSNREGFSNKSQVHFTDTFQRAMLNDCLLDVAKKNRVNISNFIQSEVQYLLDKRRKDKTGGWPYFPTVQEIAVDIDDLGQIIQLFIKSNNLQLVDKYCKRPIELALSERTHPGGGIETWIIPQDKLTKIQQKQNLFNETKWGKGPDVEVVANFIYALHLYNAGFYRIKIQDALNYIVNCQNMQGSWDSRWYYGNYYGTYVCLRILQLYSNQYQITIQKAVDFIFSKQNKDSGWGLNEISDPLNTAFALLSLKLYIPKTDRKIKKAENYLTNCQLSDGGWQSVDFIKPKAQEPYKSKTLTAALVLKALSV